MPQFGDVWDEDADSDFAQRSPLRSNIDGGTAS